MEFLLNFAWMVVATVACAYVGVRLVRERGGRRLTIFFAVVCVLALLFPIISVSDDLSADRDTIEASSALRRSVVAAAHHVSPDLLGLVVVICVVLSLIALARVVDESMPALSVCLITKADPRSPPRL